jgi:hypothetical protein
MEHGSNDNHCIIFVCDNVTACENKRDRLIDLTRNITGEKTMFNLISMKLISATAISLSLLLGTLAVSPVSPAFAKSDSNKSYLSKEGSAVTSHRRTGLVYDGGSSKGAFRHTFRIGNRSISHQ